LAYKGFPIKYPECPICHSKECIGSAAFDELVQQGNKNIPVDTFKALEAQQLPLEDPRTAKGTFPMLVIAYDVCAKCGTKRVVKVEMLDVPVMIQNRPPAIALPNGPLPRSFKFGG